MNELKKDKKYIFYLKNFRYEGYIISQNQTHFTIQDIKSNKIFHLPKSETVVEEMT